MKFKDNVSFNLTIKTSKYHNDLSKLTFKKIKALFFENFHMGPQKNHSSSLGSKSLKVTEFNFRVCVS